MTRPGYVMVEFPIEEAEALLVDSATDLGAWKAGRLGSAALHRINHAVKVERGPGGSSPAQVKPVSEKAA